MSETPEPRYERPLAVEELSMYRQEVDWSCGRIGRVAEVSAAEVARLDAVVEDLRRHPFLARVLETDDAGEVVFRAEPGITIPVVVTSQFGHAGLLDEMLGSDRFGVREPLLRIFRSRSGDRHHLGLLVHHSLADGRSTSCLLGEILSRLAGSAAQDFGTHPVLPASTLADPVGLAERRDAYAQRSAEQIFGEGFRIPAGSERAVRSTVRLLTGDMAALRARWGIEQASTTACVMFFLGRALAAEYGATMPAMTAGFTVDGRALVGLPADALGAFQLGGLVRLDVASDPVSAIGRLGHEVRGQARDPAILASLELQAMALEQMTSTAESLVPLVVSNTGSVPGAEDRAVWGCVPYHCFGSAVYASVVVRRATAHLSVVVPAQSELDRRIPSIIDRFATETGFVAGE